MTTRSSSALRIYYLAALLFYIAVFLRSLLIYQDSPYLNRILVLLLVMLAIYLSEPVISRRWPGYFIVYVLIQTTHVFILLALPQYSDFFAALFGIISMQILLKLKPIIGTVWIVAVSLITAFILMNSNGVSQAVALTLIYTAANIFLGTYALAIRREQTAQERKMELAHELQEANRQLEDYSTQLANLAVARERNRFARDLHDSVTQTVFSMTLITQSAITLYDLDPSRVKEQLERLSRLARVALGEMQALISTLKPDEASKPGIVPALQRLLEDARFTEQLSVSLQVDGEGPLTFAEQQALLGITQEALNNIVKHASIKQAEIRLHLDEPCWMEIEDQGLGFARDQARGSGRMGLTSMQERAEDIGWVLRIITSPGAGTCIRVEKSPKQEELL